jgi:RarD protein
VVDTQPLAPTAVRIPLLASTMAFAAGLVWSLGALMARLAGDTDAWQYLIWRSIGILIVMELLTRARRRPPLLPIAYTSGRLMLLACGALLLASVAFVYAVKNTTAANAAFLASVTPLIAVVLARLFIGERLTRVTIAGITLALVGLLVMVTADLGAGNIHALRAQFLSETRKAARHRRHLAGAPVHDRQGPCA